jgi:tRNA G18 (ribose-2'-O)-methylase SpoU
MPRIVVVAHNIRSTYNIGSIFRTCDGFGVEQLYLTGYSPYPAFAGDPRPPHIRTKMTAQIAKTALGAESSVHFEYADDPLAVIATYRRRGYTIAALEQTPASIMLPDYQPPEQLLLVLGEEVYGTPASVLEVCDVALEIPMAGKKESFNVSVATGIALYALTTRL